MTSYPSRSIAEPQSTSPRSQAAFAVHERHSRKRKMFGHRTQGFSRMAVSGLARYLPAPVGSPSSTGGLSWPDCYPGFSPRILSQYFGLQRVDALPYTGRICIETWDQRIAAWAMKLPGPGLSTCVYGYMKMPFFSVSLRELVPASTFTEQLFFGLADAADRVLQPQLPLTCRTSPGWLA